MTGPSVTSPSVLTGTVIAVGVAVTAAAGRRPGRARSTCSAAWEYSSGEPPLWPCRSSTRSSRRGCARGWTRSRRRCSSHVQSEAGFVTEAARHLLDAGGKRFRPLLVLLAAETGDPDADGVLTSACVVELTHLASLYHDDVMDEADLRRGAESANARWDNHVAILTGDFLFSKSSELDRRPRRRTPSASRRRPSPGSSRARSSRRSGPRDEQDPLEHYLRVVAGKTGSLIATSARYGAHVRRRPARRRGGADGVRREGRRGLPALRRHPRHRLGDRGVGQDARHRPARGRADAAGADRAALHRPADARLLELLGSDLTDDALHAEALALLRAHPAMAEARAYVVEPRRRGQGSCSRCCPRARVRAALEAFADAVATRSS